MALYDHTVLLAMLVTIARESTFQLAHQKEPKEWTNEKNTSVVE